MAVQEEADLLQAFVVPGAPVSVISFTDARGLSKPGPARAYVVKAG